MQSIDALLNLNKSELFAELDQVQNRNNLYVVQDLIEVLSQKKERDKRMVSDYSPEEVQTYMIRRGDVSRLVRFFTRTGITRYLHEGKIIDYLAACEYFGVEPRDLKTIKLMEEIKHMCVGQRQGKNIYRTSSLLKWIFAKRRMCKALGETTELSAVIEMFALDADVSDRIDILRRVALD